MFLIWERQHSPVGINRMNDTPCLVSSLFELSLPTEVVWFKREFDSVKEEEVDPTPSTSIRSTSRRPCVPLVPLSSFGEERLFRSVERVLHADSWRRLRLLKYDSTYVKTWLLGSELSLFRELNTRKRDLLLHLIQSEKHGYRSIRVWRGRSSIMNYGFNRSIMNLKFHFSLYKCIATWNSLHWFMIANL